jgi:hypothetical protein
MDYNTKMQIRHLCSYITDRSAVLNYVNREKNLKLTMKHIEQVMSKAPRQKRSNFKPMKPSPQIATHNGRGYDPLAMALFQYHANRTTGAEHDFWLSRLLSTKGRRAKVSV